jgi:hypothetical protein
MTLHNKRQISDHSKNTSVGQLVCPHCQTTFPITWRRYWAAPLGDYRCPECRQMFHPATILIPWVLTMIIVGMTLVGIIWALFGAYVMKNIHHNSKTTVISVVSWSNTLLSVRRNSEFFP